MRNSYIKEELKRMAEGVSIRRSEQQRAERHRRNVAALVDFTSNLINVLGNSGVSSFNQPSKNHKGSFNRFNSSLRDYKGAIAGNMFRTRFAPYTGWGEGINKQQFKI